MPKLENARYGLVKEKYRGKKVIFAATGHRPKSLWKGYDEEGLKLLMNLALSFLKEQKDVSALISGMALGWDTAWALAAVKLDLPLIAAVPFLGQESLWPATHKERYWKLLKYAESTGKVVVVSEGGYSPQKMLMRNEWMVDNSDRVVALWNGSRGGTEHCIRYAQSQGVEVSNLWPKYRNLILKNDR